MIQANVQMEIAAIYAIIEICKSAGYNIVGSIAVKDELTNINEPDKLKSSLTFYRETVNLYIPMSTNIRSRAAGFMSMGLKDYDSFHLAFAEAAGADYLLTTDTRFEHACTKDNLSIVNVINPSNFLPEVVKWAQQ
jgi:predicted nucleic acid-binding protein